MRHYYDAEFTHVIDYHPDDIMENLKKKYDEDLFNLIGSFLTYQISERELVDLLREYIIAAAELVYEDHSD